MTEIPEHLRKRAEAARKKSVRESASPLVRRAARRRAGPVFDAGGFDEAGGAFSTESFTTNTTNIGPMGPTGAVGPTGAEGPPGRDCDITREEFDELKRRLDVVEGLLANSERERIEGTGEFFP